MALHDKFNVAAGQWHIETTVGHNPELVRAVKQHLTDKSVRFFVGEAPDQIVFVWPIDAESYKEQRDSSSQNQ